MANTETVQPPIPFGALVYVPSAWSWRQERVICPVCYGKLYVRVILGNDEVATVECDACTVGYERATGYITEHTAGSRIDTAMVEGFVQVGDQWDVICDHQKLRLGVAAFTTREEAEAVRAKMFAECVEQAKDQALRMAMGKRKKISWTIGYHRGKLKEAERQVAYHSEHLSDALAKKKTTPSTEVST